MSVKRFLHRCSGADLELLYAPDVRTDHAKYVGVGAAVFFTALFAVFSSSFALYYVFQSWWVVSLGVIWGSFIFSLDRYIVSTMRKGNGWQMGIGSALPRIVIAFFLALVISKPLELRIFQSEIDNELAVIDTEERARQQDQVRARVEATRPDVERQRDDAQRKIDQAAAQQQQLEQEAVREKDGTSGSRRYGDGPAYQAKKALADAAAHSADSLRRALAPELNRLNQRIQGLQDSSQQAVAMALADRQPPEGLLARINALARLQKHSGAMERAGLVLALLFIILETSPVLVKLLSPAGPYDYKLNAIEEQVKAQEIEAVSTVNQQVNRNLSIALGESDQVVNAQLQANKDLLSRINSAQLEIAQEMIDQWKNGELAKLRPLSPTSGHHASSGSTIGDAIADEAEEAVVVEQTNKNNQASVLDDLDTSSLMG